MLTSIHGALSNTIWLFFLFIALWGFVRAFRRQGINGSYLGALVIGELLFVLQAVLGTVLWITGARPGRDWIHVLYGVFAIVFLPFLFGVLHGDDSNRGQWVFAIATLFMFGVSLRLIETGM